MLLVHRTAQAVRLASCVAAYTARVAGQSLTSADVRWSLRHDGPENRHSVRAWADFLVDDAIGLQSLSA
jgi:hypothetical protein